MLSCNLHLYGQSKDGLTASNCNKNADSVAIIKHTITITLEASEYLNPRPG